MKRRPRDINIFSMSALDLFASALGAFILLTVIFIPFFPNTGDSPERVEELKAALASISEALGAAESKANQLQAENAGLQEANQGLESELNSEKKRTTLLGIETEASRIVLLIDMSGSMNLNGDDFRPLMGVTVTRILEAVQDDVELAMIGFHAPQDIVNLVEWPSQGFAKVSASRQQAMTQVAAMMARVEGGTPTGPAIRAAFERSPEAIIVLTDGAPTIPNDDWQALLAQIASLNSSNIEIHSVAIGPFYDNPVFAAFLGALANQNNGDVAAAIP